MKKAIITILLALVAMTGQAQVKSGIDLCLRDEVTGEWLIGLFDDYAIYTPDGEQTFTLSGFNLEIIREALEKASNNKNIESN